MTNCTSDFLTDCGYNFSRLIGDDVINNPSNWLAALNTELSGIFIITLLVVFGFVLFLVMNKKSDTTTIESAAFAGIIISITGVLLFVIDVTVGAKLITWQQLLPIIIITAITIGIYKATQRY